MRILIVCIIVGLFSFRAMSQSGTWTWMKGDSASNIPPIFGTKGVPDPLNNPSYDYQCSYWTDKQGNLWLYAGVEAFTNDLWKFDVTTNNWTWMNGFQNALTEYGVQGIPSPNNVPGIRVFGTNCWTDNDGNLWLYSGASQPDDLWKYTIATNEWTWMKGDSFNVFASNYPPVFGPAGTSGPLYTPGDLNECKSGWTSKDNKLWLFGGWDAMGAMNNHLWRFDISTNQWAWMKGDTTLIYGNYGTLGVESAATVPPVRLSFASRWMNDSDELFVFSGGQYFAITNPNVFFFYNDVFRYKPSSNNWTWLSGANTSDNIGQVNGYCLPDVQNTPSARGEANTITTNGCYRTNWLFGGTSTIFANPPPVRHALNDLWTFNESTLKWTLVKGSPFTTGIGIRGVKGIPNVNNIPDGRTGCGIWEDKDHNIWIFGGVGNKQDSSGFVFDALNFNDLWKFTPDYSCMNEINPSLFPRPTDTVICKGESTVVALNEKVSFTITPNEGFTVSQDSSLINFNPTSNTSYTVIASDPCDFKDTIIFQIIVIELPIASFNFSKAVYDVEDGSIVIINNSMNAISYAWYIGDSLFSILPNPTYPIDLPKEYCFKLVATNLENCKDTLVRCVEAVYTPQDTLFIPNAFSPNGDGKNDEFGIKSNTILNFNLYIYDRYGNQMILLENPSEKWNGTFKGTKCDIGVYFYYMTYIDSKGIPQTIKGEITLLR